MKSLIARFLDRNTYFYLMSAIISFRFVVVALLLISAIGFRIYGPAIYGGKFLEKYTLFTFWWQYFSEYAWIRILILIGAHIADRKYWPYVFKPKMLKEINWL